MRDESLLEKNLLILQREQDAINSQLNSNHDSWDSQIITLSIAALGFSFSLLDGFIPFSTAQYGCLFTISTLAFVAAITATTINYWISDRGIMFWMASNKARMEANLKLIIKTIAFNTKMKRMDEIGNDTHRKYKSTQDSQLKDSLLKELKSLSDERQSLIEDHRSIIDATYNESEPTAEENQIKMTKNNRVVKCLNTIKTFSFIVGVAILTIYILINIPN